MMAYFGLSDCCMLMSIFSPASVLMHLDLQGHIGCLIPSNDQVMTVGHFSEKKCVNEI